MESIYANLALSGSTNECARTDTVFFPISQVYTRGVTLVLLVQKLQQFYFFYGLKNQNVKNRHWGCFPEAIY